MLGVTGNVQTWLVISGIFDFQPYDHILIDPQFSKHIFHMKPPIRHKYIDQPLYPHLPLWSFFFITVISHEILIPHEKIPEKNIKKSHLRWKFPKSRLRGRGGQHHPHPLLGAGTTPETAQCTGGRRGKRGKMTWRTENG